MLRWSCQVIIYSKFLKSLLLSPLTNCWEIFVIQNCLAVCCCCLLLRHDDAIAELNHLIEIEIIDKYFELFRIEFRLAFCHAHYLHEWWSLFELCQSACSSSTLEFWKLIDLHVCRVCVRRECVQSVHEMLIRSQSSLIHSPFRLMTRNKNIKVEVQNDFIDVMRSASVLIPNVSSARIHQITLGSENRAIEDWR